MLVSVSVNISLQGIQGSIGLWGEVGPRGPRGDGGLKGPVGPLGVTGYPVSLVLCCCCRAETLFSWLGLIFFLFLLMSGFMIPHGMTSLKRNKLNYLLIPFTLVPHSINVLPCVGSKFEISANVINLWISFESALLHPTCWRLSSQRSDSWLHQVWIHWALRGALAWLP